MYLLANLQFLHETDKHRTMAGQSARADNTPPAATCGSLTGVRLPDIDRPFFIPLAFSRVSCSPLKTGLSGEGTTPAKSDRSAPPCM